MNTLLSLNWSAQIREPYHKKFCDLPIGSYAVRRFLLKETPYGLRLHAEIEDFYLALPKRFSDQINTQEQVEEINRERWQLVYGGRDTTDCRKLKIDFNVIIIEVQAPVIVVDDESGDEMPAQ